jgi:DNA-binding transcriptional MocR family regulator
VLDSALRPVGATGTEPAREAAARLLARGGWAPEPRDILFAGNGRQAIAALVAALVPPGERLGVEALTYPIVKGIAARLGVTLVPLAMDDDGVTPEAIRSAATLPAVYLQPALHNPLGTTMSAGRRVQIAGLLRELDLYAIEDGIYAFLREDLPPLADLAPERVIVVDSMSKRLAPGLTTGFVVTPPPMADRIASALRSGGWSATRFALDATTRLLADGTAETVQRAKRGDAAARQELMRERLAGSAVDADPHAYHCWWRLSRTRRRTPRARVPAPRNAFDRARNARGPRPADARGHRDRLTPALVSVRKVTVSPGLRRESRSPRPAVSKASRRLSRPA